MTIRFVFKSGYTFDMKCKNFSLSSSFGKIESWEADGIIENKPIHMDFEDILCVYRIVSDEVE